MLEMLMKFINLILIISIVLLGIIIYKLNFPPEEEPVTPEVIVPMIDLPYSAYKPIIEEPITNYRTYYDLPCPAYKSIIEEPITHYKTYYDLPCPAYKPIIEEPITRNRPLYFYWVF